MKVILGNDHRGVALKEAAKKLLMELRIPFEDLGVNSTEACDYPDFAAKVGRAVAAGDDRRGLLFCGSGIGMAIAANKVPGIRCASVCDKASAILSRQHNDANVLAIGELQFTAEQSNEVIRAWLEARFEGGRHQLRIDKIAQLERESWLSSQSQESQP